MRTQPASPRRVEKRQVGRRCYRSLVPTVDEEVARYLATGDSDPLFRAWPEVHTLYRCQQGDAALREALVAEVRRRTAAIPPAGLPEGLSVEAFLRLRLQPMVEGLFPAIERELVLGALVRGVCLLTSDNIEQVLRDTDFPETAWTLANMYLLAAGAAPLAPDAPAVVGLSEGTTSYVSFAYFAEADVFADFIVHEAAHVFHNCKRETIGLSPRPRQPWLLDIAYTKRETFAYACEAYRRLLDLGNSGDERRAWLDRLAKQPPPPDDRVSGHEYLEILADACSARNGWKRILARCSG